MSEEKKEKWLGYLAITTVIFAVFATLSTFNGGKFSTRAVMSQSQASNKWSHYQSKSLKGYLYEVRKGELELAMEEKGASMSPKLLAAYQKNLAHYRDQVTRYEQEKKELMAEAQRLEQVRDKSQIHSRHFGYAIIFLQIAILISGIAGFVRNWHVWLFSMIVGVMGMLLFWESFFLVLEPLMARLL